MGSKQFRRLRGRLDYRLHFISSSIYLAEPSVTRFGEISPLWQNLTSILVRYLYTSMAIF